MTLELPCQIYLLPWSSWWSVDTALWLGRDLCGKAPCPCTGPGVTLSCWASPTVTCPPKLSSDTRDAGGSRTPLSPAGLRRSGSLPQPLLLPAPKRPRCPPRLAVVRPVSLRPSSCSMVLTRLRRPPLPGALCHPGAASISEGLGPLCPAGRTNGRQPGHVTAGTLGAGRAPGLGVRTAVSLWGRLAREGTGLLGSAGTWVWLLGGLGLAGGRRGRAGGAG